MPIFTGKKFTPDNLDGGNPKEESFGNPYATSMHFSSSSFNGRSRSEEQWETETETEKATRARQVGQRAPSRLAESRETVY